MAGQRGRTCFAHTAYRVCIVCHNGRCKSWEKEALANHLSLAGIKRWISTGFKSKHELDAEKDQQYEIYNEERRLKGKMPVDWKAEEAEAERIKSTKD